MSYNVNMKKVAVVFGIIAFIGLCLLIPKLKKHDVDVINVNNMPGHKASKLNSKVLESTNKKPTKTN